MTTIVLLDSGPLGMLSNPRGGPENEAGIRWLDTLLAQGAKVLVPEIADYEVRRELMRAGRVRGLARLDTLGVQLGYIPLTTRAMHQAAVFWAEVRQRGPPTADPHALDGDVILAAQARTLDVAQDDRVVVATLNARHWRASWRRGTGRRSAEYRGPRGGSVPPW